MANRSVCSKSIRATMMFLLEETLEMPVIERLTDNENEIVCKV